MDAYSNRLSTSGFSSILDMYHSEMEISECPSCRTLRQKYRGVKELLEEANSSIEKYKRMLKESLTN